LGISGPRAPPPANLYWEWEVYLFREIGSDIFGGPGHVETLPRRRLAEPEALPGYAVVSALGLGLGFAVALFVALFLRFELSYDRHVPDHPRVFRVIKPDFPGSPYIFSRRILTEIPEVEDLCAVKQAVSSSFSPRVILTADGKRRFEERMFCADASFFRIFGVRFIHGRPETALAHPRAVVLTRRAAVRHFGTTDCLGRVILFEDKLPLQVEGVIENPPASTHFKFDVVAPVEAASAFSGYDDHKGWGDWNYYVYLLLKPGASARGVEPKLALCFPEDVRRKRAGSSVDPASLRLQRLTDIHLRSHLRGELEANGDIRWVFFFSALGALILGVSVLNFVNLATAQALRRNREVGLRKVLGAGRREIAVQHMGEALLLTSAAAALGLALLRLALPVLGGLSGSGLGREGFPWGPAALFFAPLVALVAAAAGGYPAFFAASLRPLATLRGSGGARPGVRRSRGRSLVLGFQFMVSVGFITAAFIVFAQLGYLRSKDLGIDTHRIVTIRLTDAIRERTGALKTELLAHPGVLAASVSDFLPGEGERRQTFDWEGRKPDEDQYLRWIAVDADFLGTFDVRLLEGEGFGPGDGSRGEWLYLVNESAVRRFGWDRAAGKRLEVLPWGKPGRVAGVVNDFQFRPLHHPVEPLALVLCDQRPRLFRFISVKVSGRDLRSTLRFLDDFCSKNIAEGGGTWAFFDEEFGRLYEREIRTSRLIGLLALLAAALAGLGVFGLTAFMVESRRKEIGVRKVLGADALRVLALFSGGFLRVMTVGGALAAPAVYLGARAWLQGFAYRITLGPWYFAAGFVLMAAVLLAAVGWHTIRAANTDPAAVLRSE
jgi:putative ABC transport system permease protein